MIYGMNPSEEGERVLLSAKSMVSVPLLAAAEDFGMGHHDPPGKKVRGSSDRYIHRIFTAIRPLNLLGVPKKHRAPLGKGWS